MEGIRAMSQKELGSLQIIKKIEKKELRVDEGVDLMGISQRQTYRVLKRGNNPVSAPIAARTIEKFITSLMR